MPYEPYEWANPQIQDEPTPFKKRDRFRKAKKKHLNATITGLETTWLSLKVKWRRSRGRPAYLDETVIRKKHLQEISDSRGNPYVIRKIEGNIVEGMKLRRIKLASTYGCTSLATGNTIVVTVDGEWLEVCGNGKMYRVLYEDFEEGAQALANLPKEEWDVVVNIGESHGERKHGAVRVDEVNGGAVEVNEDEGNENAADLNLIGQHLTQGSQTNGSNEDQLEDSDFLWRDSPITDFDGWIPILETKVPDPDLDSLVEVEIEVKQKNTKRKSNKRKPATEHKKENSKLNTGSAISNDAKVNNQVVAQPLVEQAAMNDATTTKQSSDEAAVDEPSSSQTVPN